MLNIKNLHVTINDKKILNGIDLSIQPGEVHAVMGPNGSGKSTLSYVLAGREGYEVVEGQVLFSGQDLLAMEPEKRAGHGLFLAFQYPVEIPGVNNAYFMRAAYNAVRKFNNEPLMDAMEFMKYTKDKAKLVKMDKKFLSRSVNDGFSGGEKKRNEILQMAVMEPKLAVLDEIDSGLDIDAMAAAAEGVNALRNKDRSLLIITHYQRLLNYIQPDFVHVLSNGKFVKSGGKELALELEKTGYTNLAIK